MLYAMLVLSVISELTQDYVVANFAMQWNSLFENLGLGYTGLCNHYKDARINVEKMKKKTVFYRSV